MSRRARIVVVAAAVLAIVAVVAAVRRAPTGDRIVDLQLLAINDFHGGLEPVTGGGGRIGGSDAGGIEYLATHLARLKAMNPRTFIISAGDNIGATPLLSSLFHDEPSIEALNLAGLQISALGNHDLDEGWWELYRIQRGGCHPIDGCQDGTPFSGASFPYLAANVTLDPREADPEHLKLAGIEGSEPRPLFPGYTVREADGVRIGFIGLVLHGVPRVIVPGAIRGLSFHPESEAANAAAKALRGQGVRAVVVLMHEGGVQGGSAVVPGGAFDINGCEDMTPAFIELIGRMSDDIDVVVSGHSHAAYNCTIDRKLVTSASSAGRLITDIDLQVRQSDGEVVSKAARNIIVTRDVPSEPAQTALLARYRPLGETIGNRVVGSIVDSLTRTTNDAGESSIGDVVADALLDAAERTPGANPDLAIWNPGGIRDDLIVETRAASTPVTYARIFAVLPFGNDLIVKSVTGDVLLQMLEEQFAPDRTRIMQVSAGFSYAYDASRPIGRRIDRESVRLNGAPLVPAQVYRLATSNFLWAGGDGLAALSRASSEDTLLVGTDHDILADYFSRHSPVRPRLQTRIRRVK